MGLDLRVLRVIAHMAVESAGGGFLPDETFLLPQAHWLVKWRAGDPEHVAFYMGCVN